MEKPSIGRWEMGILIGTARLNRKAYYAGYASHEAMVEAFDSHAAANDAGREAEAKVMEARRLARKAKMKAMKDQLRHISPISGTLDN